MLFRSVRWGAPSIFFTRWLITGLGPWVNLSSGVASYPWLKFAFWDVLGELVWVAAYVTLGRLFSDRIQDLADLVGNVGYLLLGLVVAVASGYALLREFRRAAARADPGQNDQHRRLSEYSHLFLVLPVEPVAVSPTSAARNRNELTATASRARQRQTL